MKKTFIFGLIAAALGFTACSSEDDLNVNDNNQKKGMVLRATVEQPAESRATFTDNEGVWQFAFTTNDNVFVRNGEMSQDKHWMFTKGTGDFTCISAIETTSPVTWYAYFPQVIMNFNQQSGKKEDVANFYALSGTTTKTTTGKDGLSITMEPQVAILVIDNQIGSIDINVKTGQNSWVSSLKAKTGEKGFELVTDEGKVSLLTTNTPGIYYIAVPAGVQLAVKNGDKVIRSTGEKGLTAGKYYNLTVIPFGQGEEAAKGIGKVRWIQLWEGGPKFAEYNVGATKKTDTGTLMSYSEATNTSPEYVWGSNWCTSSKPDMEELLKAAKSTRSDKVTCEYGQVDGVFGFNFTGKGNYINNSVFFPASYGDSDQGTAYYWSCTPCGNGTEDFAMYLNIDAGGWKSGWAWEDQYSKHSVRPVLKEH